LTLSKPPISHAIAFKRLEYSGKELQKRVSMETVTESTSNNKNGRVNKGGRPKKQHHLDQKITVMCTRFDLIAIRYHAKECNISVSEYLRELGLKRQVDRKVKVLPKEVLQLMGALNHMAANINQVAYRRNRGYELNAIERAELMVLAGEIKELAKTIKAAFK
jgi:hypothetical protein